MRPTASGELERGSQLQIFMNPGASHQTIQAVGTELAQLNTIEQPCPYHDKQWNYNEARKIAGSVIDGNVTESAMPTSFWCTPIALSDAAPIVKTFANTPGVLAAVAPLSQIRTQEKVINIGKWVFLALAVVLIVSASVLILNSIRMAIFARRREVSVMKLVGATNWFIRIPFMSEGMLQGLLGSGMAAVALYLVYLFVNHIANTASQGNLLQTMHLSSGDVIVTDIVLLVVGALVGSLGSAVAIRRFLDV